jgi:hypothetical protein
MWYIPGRMPSKPKLWMLADENERFKIFRYQDQKKPDLWVELRYNKVAERWTHVRCAFTEEDSGWHRWEAPIRNHAVAKRRSFLYLLDSAFESVPGA